MGVNFSHETGHHCTMQNQAVHFPAFHDHFGDDRRKNLHVQIKSQINGVGAGSMRRDQGTDPALQFFRIAGDLKTAQINIVRDGGAGTAGIGDDAYPFALQGRLRGECPAVAVEVFDGMDTDDPGLFENAFIEEIRTGHGAGVTHAGAGTGAGTTDVLSQDGFMGRDFLGGFDKTAAITDAFNIQDNGLRMLVLPQIFQGVNDVDIRLIADADGLAEPDPSFPEIGQRLGHIGAALGGQSKGSWFSGQMGYRQIERDL